MVRKGRPTHKLEGIKGMISECAKMIENDKTNSFLKAGQALADPGTPIKTYWPLINTVLNKAKIPIIPPLLENGLFITYFAKKADQIFNDHFILQCRTKDMGSEIPPKIQP